MTLFNNVFSLVSVFHITFTGVPQYMRVGPAATVPLANQIFGLYFGNYGLEIMLNIMFCLGYVLCALDHVHCIAL